MTHTMTWGTRLPMPDTNASDMMGGPIGLALPRYDNFPYPESVGCAWLSSGRAALECLLRNMPRPQRVLVPRYVCDTILQPIERLGLPVHCYATDSRLAPHPPPDATSGDLLLLVNYFGLTGDAVRAAALRHPGPVVVDATTALYSPPQPGLPTFYSPRKFAGLSDGGVACAPFPLQLPAAEDVSAPRATCLLQQLEAGTCAAAPAFDAAETDLCHSFLRMSPLTRRLLSSIDWEAAARRRLENYAILHRELAHINRLQLPDAPAAAPMCYPLVCGIPGLRDDLIDAGIALPLYWPEVITATTPDQPENDLARTLLPLPLDQRYTPADMRRLLSLILS